MLTFLSKYLPKYETLYPKIKKSWIYKIFGDALFHPRLWEIEGHALAKAWLIGILTSFSPFIGIHIALALVLCMIFRANIPLTMILQAWSNPIITPFYFSAAYKLGCFLLKEHPVMSEDHPLLQGHFMAALQSLEEKLWPLFFGCTVISLVVGGIGYLFIYFRFKNLTK